MCVCALTVIALLQQIVSVLVLLLSGLYLLRRDVLLLQNNKQNQKLRGENKHNIKENVCVWRSKKCVTHRQLLGQFDHHVLQIILQTLELLIGGLEEVRTAA